MSRIIAISVEKLFGRIDYPKIEFPANNQIALIYGENGSGKTTILNMIYHSISPESGEGHRTFIARTVFKSFKIEFQSERYLRFFREAATNGNYTVEHNLNKEIIQFEVICDENFRVRDEINSNLDENLEFLKSLSAKSVFLTEDRLSHGLTASESVYWSRSVIRNIRHYPNINEQPIERATIEAIKNQYLLSLLHEVEGWVRRAMSVSRRKSESETSKTIVNILTSITDDKYDNVDVDRFVQRIRKLDFEIKPISRYGMMSPNAVKGIADKIESISDQKVREFAVRTLTPYVESLILQVRQLEKVYRLVNIYIESLNQFFVDKKVHFSEGTGIHVLDDNGGTIRPIDLSSGERQLLHLFSTALIARERTSLILIDEPELSLSAHWQRKLASVLAKLIERSNAQLVMATHSIEILSQYEENIVRLNRA